MYIPLRIHSPYSIAEGAATPKDLAAWAKAHGIPALGVADTTSLNGIYPIKEALKKRASNPCTACKSPSHTRPSTGQATKPASL